MYINKVLKLYVWEGVLTDYTDGMVCVLAYSEHHAWELLFNMDGSAFMDICGFHWEATPSKIPESAPRPKEINAPEAFVCFGGEPCHALRSTSLYKTSRG